MTKYEKLIIYAEKLGAEVRELNFGTSKKCGRCLNNIIYINSNMLEVEKYEILAEELGHYKTTYGNILNQNIISNKKLESVARREAFNMLVEPTDIVEAMINGAKDIYEMAEYVSISVDTLIDVIADFKKRYGTGVYVDNYYLRLEPQFGICRNMTI